MNDEQRAAVSRLCQAVAGLLPDLSFGPGTRGQEMKLWLAELERDETSVSRIRTIAASLGSVARELERQPEPPDLPAAAASLAEAATAVVVAF
jgi:hypothetical protein